VAAGSGLSPGAAWWWPLRAQLPVRGGCSAWRGVAGPDPAGASLQLTAGLPPPVPMTLRWRSSPTIATVRLVTTSLTRTNAGCLPRLAGYQARRKARGAAGASCPAVKGECPAPRRRAFLTAQPFALDGLPGTRRAGHGRWRGGGRAFGACCFAGKLRSPAPLAQAFGLRRLPWQSQPDLDATQGGIAARRVESLSWRYRRPAWPPLDAGSLDARNHPVWAMLPMVSRCPMGPAGPRLGACADRPAREVSGEHILQP
jgi:hypothetical protein